LAVRRHAQPRRSFREGGWKRPRPGPVQPHAQQQKLPPRVVVLIVAEGSKTEPNYFREIRAAYRLHTANVEVQPGERGTAPIQVVDYARDLFANGDPHKGIQPPAFEQIDAVFDRDNHGSYFDALRLAASLDGKLRSDNRQVVTFKAIASVPSFELWLLLHYEHVKVGFEHVRGLHRASRSPSTLKPRARQLARDNERLQGKLDKAMLIIDVQNKVSALLGLSMPDDTPGSS